MAKNIHKWLLLLVMSCLTMTMMAQKNARYHTVEEGQTLYSIARLYNLSPSELMKLNPDVGDLIQPGDKLRIPDNAKATPVANGPGAAFVGGTGTATTGGKSPCKEMYQIKKKDTLYRIAVEHGVTVQEMIIANPGLTEEGKLKKGEWLCIPFSKAELQAEADRLAKERALAEANAKKTHKSHLSVAVVLPLKENTDRGGKMVEFYQGLLMAVDSVRKQGTSVDVYAYHSGNGVADLNSILAKEEMKSMDVVFGPLDGVQATLLSNFCQQNKIRLVMPFATTNTYASSNPYAYVAMAPSDVTTQAGATLTANRFGNYHFVVIETGETDKKGQLFVGQLSQQLGSRGVTAKHVNVDADDMAFASALSPFRNNMVVLNSSSATAVQKATKKLRAFLKEHTEYKISLVGYPEWTTYQGSILQDFHELDTYAFTAFFRNGNDARIQNFERRFKANFHHDLIKVLPRYGMTGMDLGYYFLHGLAKQGDFFDEKVGSMSFSPLQSDYRFGTTGTSKAKTNLNAYFVHYNRAGQIETTK